MIGKLFARIRRNWPLVTRARLNRVIALRVADFADNAKQLAHTKQEAEENRRHATAMQIRLTELMRANRHAVGSVSHGWAELAASIIREARQGQGRILSTHFRGPTLATAAMTGYDLHRFGIEIGMSPDTPPELVAGQIADSVRAFILENWRTQSLLLTKE